jgi:integrase
MILMDLMHIWLFEVMKPKIAYNSFSRYESVYRNYILKLDKLATRKVYAVTPLELQRLYNEMSKDGKSKSIILNLNKLLRTFFNYAILEGYITRNPTFKLTIPDNACDVDVVKDIDPFSDDEIGLIIDSAKDEVKFMYILAFATGLRRGELLGLRVKDVDLENSEIHVVNALKDVKDIETSDKYTYKTVLEPPKTKSSIRSVPLPSSIISGFKSHINKQKEKCISLGMPYNDDCFLFSSESGNVLNSRNCIRAWERTLKRAGVRYRKFHNTLHTYATKLFEQGVPIKTVQKLLGHSNMIITSEIYTHVMPKEKENAVDKLNFIFEKGIKN